MLQLQLILMKYVLLKVVFFEVVGIVENLVIKLWTSTLEWIPNQTCLL